MKDLKTAGAAAAAALAIAATTTQAGDGLAGATARAAAGAAVVGGHAAASGDTAGRPNVVVVMTDDQTVADLARMPHTRALVADAGVTFDRSYASYPVCAPSRATFLSGQYAHNHGVMGVYRPTGGYTRFDATNALPTWLRAAGYRTTHIGKYVNGYGTEAPATVPPGWTSWYGAVDPSTYRMWGYSLNENGRVRTYGTPHDEDPRLYQTDVLARHATRTIEQEARGEAPFFLSVAFLAPHHESAGVRRATGRVVRPAPRHAGTLAGAASSTSRMRSLAYNEADVSDKPGFIPRRRLSPSRVASVERRRRERQESLLSVDEAVAEIVATLRRTGELENTYVVFTSDNGYLQGEHRIEAGKLLPYEPSARVPLIVRGPGIPAGERSRALVSNVDLAPTIVDLAGARAGRRLDGRSLLGLARDPGRNPNRAILLESGGASFVGGGARGGLGSVGGPGAVKQVRAYRAIRTDRWLYVRYRNGDRELYDLERDPEQLQSLHADARYARTRARLAAGLHRLVRPGA